MKKSGFISRSNKILSLCAVVVLLGVGILIGEPKLDPSASDPNAAEKCITNPKEVEAISTLQKGIECARDKVYPALVNIEPIIDVYEDGRKRKTTATGSGTILTKEGHVLTNYHVTRGAKVSICTLFTKETIKADLVGEDPLTDLAVIKLRLKERPKDAKPLSVADFGDSSKMQVGDYVLAMGSPMALSQSVTLGIINNKDRVFETRRSGVNQEMLSGMASGLLTKWLQHDASISPGNSGGPLVNLQGEVVGINELGSFMGGDMGFAIPSVLAQDIFKQIITKKYVTRSWLGLNLQPLPDKVIGKGVLVSDVVKDSPSEKAGLKAGDIVTEINGTTVDAHFTEEIPIVYRLTSSLPVSAATNIKYTRDGKEYTGKIVSLQMQKYEGDETELKKWGITLKDVTVPFARTQILGFFDGVIITGVRAGAAAGDAQPPLDENDIIRSINGKKVKDIKEAEDIYKTLSKNKGKMLLEVWRNAQNIYIVMDTQEKNEEEGENTPELGNAWFGIEVQVLTKDIADRVGVKEGGVRVTRVFKNAAAEKAGLQVGDIIKQIGTQDVKVTQLFEKDVFNSMVQNTSVGDKVNLGIIRNKKQMTLDIVPEVEPGAETGTASYKDKDFEFTVRDLTFSDYKDSRELEGVKGVMITEVQEAGVAGFAGLHNRDVLIAVDDKPTTTVDAYKKIVADIKKQKRTSVKLFVKRGINTYFIFIEPDYEE